MIEVYNKYDKLEITFDHLNDPAVAFAKCKEFKIKAEKLIHKRPANISVYYCTHCKKRTYINDPAVIENCDHCKNTNFLYFVGFKKSEKLVEDIIYAN